MIGVREIDDLKVKDLLMEVGGIPKCDQELDAPEGDGSDSGDDSKEGSSTWAEVLP